jgi:CheY-like chemotaxis protein
MAATSSFETILMDIEMPETDGVEAMKIIRGQCSELAAILRRSHPECVCG